MKVLAAALALSIMAALAVAEEYRSVDPKQIVDGDTFYVSVRLLDIDAPEEGKRAKCDQEGELAKKAGERLKQLLQQRVAIDIHGVDQYGRLLAKVQLADGRDVGQVLIQEHLAKPYREGQRPNWC